MVLRNEKNEKDYFFTFPKFLAKVGYFEGSENKENTVASYLSPSFPLLAKKFNSCFSRNGNYCYRNK